MIDEDFLLIPLYAHDEKGYDAAYTNKYEKVFDIKNKKYNEEQLTSFEHHWKNAYPNCYLNDIAGYAILYVHDKDIMIKYYLNGDKRKIYNHDYVHLQQYNKQLFRDIGYRQGDVVLIDSNDNESIRNSFFESLEMLGNQCKEWKIYFDKESYIKKIKAFNFEEYWNIDKTTSPDITEIANFIDFQEK